MTPPFYAKRVAENKNSSISGNHRVILCDDEDILRKVAKKMISACGYEPNIVNSGSELIDFLESGGVDNLTAIIIDLQMPEMSGSVLLGRLKDIAPQVPVIVSSGHIDDDYVREIREAGAVNFLNKPYSMAELCQAIDLAAEPVGVNGI
jgi:FixJ family two-component response regulator